jgi:predicted dehydrogenase
MSGAARVAFVGAGGIARCHAFAMSALRFYYDDAPEIVPVLVSSGREERARAFGAQFAFAEVLTTDALFSSRDVDSVFVLGPNRLHFEHARRALDMPGVRRVYLEKPVCVTPEEAREMAAWAQTHPHVRVQAGYQLLQSASLRRAREEWLSGALGAPVHFRLNIAHSGYLDAAYRAGRALRLAPAPEGGALVDLGSHLLSLAVAFLGPSLEVASAQALSPFPDVDPRSDLHTLIVLRDRASGAFGTVTASRISAGCEDLMELEVSGDKGAVRYRSTAPDVVEICRVANRQEWTSVRCGSDYAPDSRFPAKAVAGGWLRPLVHAHYLFFTDARGGGFVADLPHALVVQRLIGEAIAKLS